MSKTLDNNITTIKNFRHATSSLNEELQMYIQLTRLGDDDSALIEITEIQMVLSKEENEKPYLVLRCK